MVIYGALARRDTAGLAEEMDRIRQAERLDVLTLTDADGRVFYRSRNPAAATGGKADDELVTLVLKGLEPAAGTEVVAAERAGAGVASAGDAGQDDDHAHAAGPPAAAKELRSGHDAQGRGPCHDPGRAPARRALRRRPAQPQLRRSSTRSARRCSRRRSTRAGRSARPPSSRTTCGSRPTCASADGTRAIGTQASAEVADDVLVPRRARGGAARSS